MYISLSLSLCIYIYIYMYIYCTHIRIHMLGRLQGVDHGVDGIAAQPGVQDDDRGAERLEEPWVALLVYGSYSLILSNL